MPESGGLSEYLFLLIHLGVILAFAAFILILSHLLGTRKNDKEKLSPYECGIRPVGTPRQRYGMQFYIIALLFILFDIEIVYLFPWAINLRALGGLGFTEMFIFVGILGLGLVYAWRKGALEWE